MSHISKWKDFQWGLWVFKVTYHFKAAAVNITINFVWFRFCIFNVFILKKRNSKSAHLVGAASQGKTKRMYSNANAPLFSLDWTDWLVAIYYLKSNLETNPTGYNFFFFFECYFSRKREKSVANSREREIGRSFKSWDSQQSLGKSAFCPAKQQQSRKLARNLVRDIFLPGVTCNWRFLIRDILILNFPKVLIG